MGEGNWIAYVFSGIGICSNKACVVLSNSCVFGVFGDLFSRWAGGNLCGLGGGRGRGYQDVALSMTGQVRSRCAMM